MYRIIVKDPLACLGFARTGLEFVPQAVTKTLRRFEKEAFLHPENEPSLHKYGSFGHMLRLGEGVYAWR